MNPTLNDAKVESLFHQAVAQLAHYLYVLRGCKEGRDLNNWIEAETQLRSLLRFDSVWARPGTYGMVE